MVASFRGAGGEEGGAAPPCRAESTKSRRSSAWRRSSRRCDSTSRSTERDIRQTASRGAWDRVRIGGRQRGQRHRKRRLRSRQERDGIRPWSSPWPFPSLSLSLSQGTRHPKRFFPTRRDKLLAKLLRTNLRARKKCGTTRRPPRLFHHAALVPGAVL